MKKPTAWAVLIYGVLLICLGYLGYHLAGSTMSLWSGVGLGGLMVLSAWAIFAQKKEGIFMALLLTLLLTLLFSYRYSDTGRMIPAILAVASGGMLLFLLAQIGKWK